MDPGVQTFELLIRNKVGVGCGLEGLLLVRLLFGWGALVVTGKVCRSREPRFSTSTKRSAISLLLLLVKGPPAPKGKAPRRELSTAGQRAFIHWPSNKYAEPSTDTPAALFRRPTAAAVTSRHAAWVAANQPPIAAHTGFPAVVAGRKHHDFAVIYGSPGSPQRPCAAVGSERAAGGRLRPASLAFTRATVAAVHTAAPAGGGRVVRCRNNGLVPGDARSSHGYVLATCRVFVRGMASRPPHAGPVSKLFLLSRRVALDPFPQREQSDPEGARSCVSGHSWSWRFSCVRCRTPDNAGRRRIDPHFLARLQDADSHSWLIGWPSAALPDAPGAPAPRPAELSRSRRYGPSICLRGASRSSAH
jgi:hypothetical protein